MSCFGSFNITCENCNSLNIAITLPDEELLQLKCIDCDNEEYLMIVKKWGE